MNPIARLRAAPPPGTIAVMLDHEAFQIAQNRLSAESPRRGQLFRATLQRVQGELVTKGLGHSDAPVQPVADVCAKEIEEVVSGFGASSRISFGKQLPRLRMIS